MRSLFYASVACAVLTALCVVTIDEPVARWMATRDTWPQLWNRGIAGLEYPLGIEPWKWAGICVLVAGSLASLLVPRMRPQAPAWLLVALTHLLTRNLTAWLKFGTGRLRPSQWLAPLQGSRSGSRGGDTFWRDGGFSFPSGHVVLFASVLVPLALLYPRTRPLLAIVAFSMIARIAVNAHFISDTLGALALVGAVTWLCARWVRRVLPSQILPPSLR